MYGPLQKIKNFNFSKFKNMMPYKILWNYGSEGHSFYDEDFVNVHDALKKATELHFTNFLIVKIIDWKATETS